MKVLIVNGRVHSTYSNSTPDEDLIEALGDHDFNIYKVPNNTNVFETITFGVASNDVDSFDDLVLPGYKPMTKSQIGEIGTLIK